MWNDCAKECPGMNKGRLWTFDEIEDNRSKYDANNPLKKEEVLALISEQEQSDKE